MGVSSKKSRKSEFSTGSGSGRTTPVVEQPAAAPAAQPATTPATTPAATPVTEQPATTKAEPTVTESATPATTEQPKAEQSTTTPSNWSEKLSGLGWASFLKKQRIPKGADRKKYGFFKADGSFETDPEIIARAITFKQGKDWNTETQRRSGDPLPYFYPTYKHPTSGVKTGEDFSHDFSKGDNPIWKDRKGSKKVEVWIHGLEDRGKGAIDDDHYYRTTIESPSFDTWDEATPEFIMKHMVMPMAIRIGQRHEVLNDRAKKGAQSSIAVSEADPSGAFTCKFCGDSEVKDNHKNTPGFENFRAAHKIMSNGWCATALKAHNLLNPIKGSVDEA